MTGTAAVSCAVDVAVGLTEGEATVGTAGWLALVGGVEGGIFAAVVGTGGTGVRGATQPVTTLAVASAARRRKPRRVILFFIELAEGEALFERRRGERPLRQP